MARDNALAKIRASLLKRLDEIKSSLECDVDDMRRSSDGAKGDAVDVAFGTIEDDIASKLAEHGSKEIEQIMRVLERIDNDSYGICEGCSKKIAISRLKALPYCTLCISCQRLADSGNSDAHSDQKENWERVSSFRQIRTDDESNDATSKGAIS